MPSVLDVSKYLVHLSYSAGEQEPLTTMKLQKLLYYAQAMSLVKHGRPIFSDKIKAWVDGPVVPVVWHAYKQHRCIPCETSAVDLSIEDRVFLRQIWKAFGKYTGDELSRRTHSEKPWNIARIGVAPNDKSDAEITPSSLIDYFTAHQIELPEVPRPLMLRKGREVYRIEDAGKVLPIGI